MAKLVKLYESEPFNRTLVDVLTDTKGQALIRTPKVRDFAVSYLITHPDWFPVINDSKNDRSFKIDITLKKVLMIPHNANGEWRDADKLGEDVFIYDGNLKSALEEFTLACYKIFKALNADDYISEYYKHESPRDRLSRYMNTLEANKGKNPNELYIDVEQATIKDIL